MKSDNLAAEGIPYVSALLNRGCDVLKNSNYIAFRLQKYMAKKLKKSKWTLNYLLNVGKVKYLFVSYYLQHKCVLSKMSVTPDLLKGLNWRTKGVRQEGVNRRIFGIDVILTAQEQSLTSIFYHYSDSNRTWRNTAIITITTRSVKVKR